MSDTTQPGADNAPTEEQIVAAARVLSDRSAAACNVNKLDNWDIYGGEFIDDARAALKAASLVAPAGALVANAEPFMWIDLEQAKWTRLTDYANTIEVTGYSVKFGHATTPLYVAPTGSAAAPADEPSEREQLIACLGDDAAKLAEANPDDEMAQTMRDAAAMLESDAAADLIDAVPVAALNVFAAKWLDVDPLARDALQQVIKTRAESFATSPPIPTKGNGDTDKGDTK